MRSDLHSPPAAGNGTSLGAIIQAIDSARELRGNVPLALATLVSVEGSSYRQPGARLLVDAQQRVLAGAISGGCLEGDVAARAAEVCAGNQPVMLRYDLREDLETIWGFGSGCDGVAHVLLEPLRDDGWLRGAHAAMLRRSCAMLTTAFLASPDSGRLGHHSLIEDMSIDESDEFDAVATAFRTGQPFLATHVLDGNTFGELAEPLLAPIALHLIGAGKSAEAFAAIATTMGWQVTVVDHRAALLQAMQLPVTVTRLVRRASEGLPDLPLDSRTTIALLTHIFETDAAWLTALFPQNVPYIGVLGSRKRASRLVENVSNGQTVTDEMRNRLFAPIGLDLGGETPESIALAGIAEMEAVLHGRPGGFLRSREDAIHTRTPVPTFGNESVDVTVEDCALPHTQRHGA
ncbi:MAG: XdhC family protein, partial [Gemmatimonadota bacterium]|nr:XdhC family protein [Gemmatimonadota bacterium]